MKSHFREEKVFGSTETAPRSFFRAPALPLGAKGKPPESVAELLTLDSAAELVVRVLSGDTPRLPAALAPAVRSTLSKYQSSGAALEALQRKALSLPSEEKQARALRAVAEGQWLALL